MLDVLHDAVADAAAPVPGRRILEIGCGTGALTARLVARGAMVTAMDRDPEALDEAARRLGSGSEGRVQWIAREASALDTLPEDAFDVAVASLCLSEMDHVERGHVLRHARTRLKTDGLLVVGDEIVPRGAAERVLVGVKRLPQVVAGALGASTREPIVDLDEAIEAAGFRILGDRRWERDGLAVVVAERRA
jgi:demethylmenaquinone methyltransferase/2-methoxy-6-polyprenyl-1,4-benzoquinol methylase